MNGRRESFRIAIRRFGPFEAAVRERWDSFRRATGCALHLEPVAFDLGELHDALLGRSGLKGGEWDVGFIVTDWLAEANAAGALADLAGRLECDPPDDYPRGWPESLLRHQRFGDSVLGVPYHDGPECLVYRTDLAAAAGPPRTWEEFHALARKLTAPADRRWGTVFAAFPDGHNTVYDFCLQLWTRGGELFGPDGRVRLATPVAEAALAFYRGMLADSAAVHPDCRRMDSVQSGLAFVRGEVAMMVNWFGFAALGETSEESRVKGRVGVAPLPSAPGCAGASLNVYWLLGMGSGSPHPDEAYGFIRHCASPEGDRLLTLGGAIGCRRSTWRDAEVLGRIPSYASLETLHAQARELPRLAHWARLAAVIDRMVMAAIDTAEPERGILARAQAEAEAVGGSEPARIRGRCQ